MPRAWLRAVVLTAVATGLAPDVALAQAGPRLLTDDPERPATGAEYKVAWVVALEPARTRAAAWATPG